MDTGTLCLHHEQVYIYKYAFQQKSCCDPRKVHKRSISKHLKILTIQDSKELNSIKHVFVKPGQKLCYNCLKMLKAAESESQTCMSEIESDTSDIDFTPQPYEEEMLNKSITELGVSPLKVTRVSEQNKLSYGKRKVSQIKSAVSAKVAHVLDVEAEQLSKPIPHTTGCSDCDDMGILVTLLKEKMQVSSRQKQVQLLTLTPHSWTIAQTVHEFNVSEYKVREARKLKKERGVLAEPESKVGKPLSKDVEERVTAYYENDEHSRLLPGAKDYKSVKGPDGKREHKQKRLLLLNLNELYESYKAKYPHDKIGLSKFCTLRPQHCITVGCRGTHSVCVCTIHQNVKLMISALPSETAVTYHDLMAKLVCSVDSNLCMIHRCPECPGADELRSHLETLCGVSDRLAPDETIQYKQWLTTDRTTLQTLSMPLQEFIDTIVEKTDKLTSHHYIAKHQAAYLSSLKENLGPDEAIIILDFAENYSFVVQDAAQGFHWDNSQATLHPFVAYFNKDGQTHESMCVVSDCLQHNTITVHRFLYDVLHHMKEICPGIKKIYYFSDGAASQYKNYKNLCNLTYHLDDFGLHAEWHFFATSHGKNACDGVGGTVKREAAKASLQATLVGHILTPKDLYDWAQAHISKVKFFFIDKEDVTGHADQQNTRFASAKAVPGTRSHHCYIPDLEGNKLLVRRVSGDAVSFEVSNVRARDEPVVNVPDEVSSPELQKTSVSLKQCEIGKYVCCLYDGKWWIGLIRDKSEEDEDVQISLMHPHGPARSFQWPQREDLCYVPLMCILCLINAPSTPNGRQYHLDKADKDNVMKLV
ncbi:MAG: hypothetical protein ABW185_04670 [Sedimenticola sp.]